MPTTNINVDLDVREALGLLKDENESARLNDVIRELLEEKRPDLLEKGLKIVRLKQGWSDAAKIKRGA
jgi:predicted CopG family antitoxin